MTKAKLISTAVSQDDTVQLKGVGGSITNRGTAILTVDGIIRLNPNEGYALPSLPADAVYDTQVQLTFSGTGSKNAVVIQAVINETAAGAATNQGTTLNQNC